MEELAEIHAVEDFGFEGCAHARPGGKRQVLLVDNETLELMELRPGIIRENITTSGLNVNGRPGIIRENITTSGLNVNGLALGQQLRVGGSRLDVTAVCTPCDLMEKIRPGLRRELRGRRGMLCRVIAGGTIRQGDAIEKLSD